MKAPQILATLYFSSARPVLVGLFLKFFWGLGGYIQKAPKINLCRFHLRDQHGNVVASSFFSDGTGMDGSGDLLHALPRQ